ncbi:MAG: substrate-binding domain-containing protein [Bacteroidia bacterium]|nr:substrate-binding domain-containing protein [Bacteroidia bacterium]MDW8088973.1 substrate-binding domain-containing protein [Bacteroidia bacterium]
MWPAMFRRFCGIGWRGARRWWPLLLLAVEAVGCQGGGGVESPTTGEATIAADISLKPALEPVLEQFHRVYPRAHIRVVYTSEEAAVQGFLADSFKVAIVTRRYTAQDSAALAEQKIRPKLTPIVREGIAIVAHPACRDTLLILDTLRAWLLRKDSPYGFVIEGGSGSGILRHLRDSLLGGQMPQAKLYRADSAPAVLKYVQENPRFLGLIGAAWVCDREAEVTRKFLGSVRVVALAGEGKAYYHPYAGYLDPRFYPLSRLVYALNREPRMGVASSFVSYLAGPDGQRILLKSELRPVNAPIRVVELKERTIEIERGK